MHNILTFYYNCSAMVLGELYYKYIFVNNVLSIYDKDYRESIEILHSVNVIFPT